MRISTAQLGSDLGVEVVLFVLRFPISERHAERMQKGTVDVTSFLRQRRDLVFRNEDQIVSSPPSFQEIFEGFADDRL